MAKLRKALRQISEYSIEIMATKKSELVLKF